MNISAEYPRYPRNTPYQCEVYLRWTVYKNVLARIEEREVLDVLNPRSDYNYHGPANV